MPETPPTTDPLSGLPLRSEKPPEPTAPVENTVRGEKPPEPQVVAPEPPTAPQATEPAKPTEPTDDPATWAVPGEYRTVDDVIEAVRHGKEALGKQSNELGDLRQFREDVLRGSGDQHGAPVQPPQPEGQPQVDSQAVAAIAQPLIDSGIDEEAAWKTAFAQVQTQQQAMTAQMAPVQKMLQQLLNQGADSGYRDVATSVVAELRIGEVVSAETVEAELRRRIPAENWAGARPEERRRAVEDLADAMYGKAMRAQAPVTKVAAPPTKEPPTVNVPTPTGEVPISAEVEAVRAQLKAKLGLTDEEAGRAAQAWDKLSDEEKRRSND